MKTAASLILRPPQLSETAKAGKLPMAICACLTSGQPASGQSGAGNDQIARIRRSLFCQQAAHEFYLHEGKRPVSRADRRGSEDTEPSPFRRQAGQLEAASATMVG